MPFKKPKKRLSSDELIRKRTKDLRHAHKQDLNEIAFMPQYQTAVNTKEARKALPFEKWIVQTIPLKDRLELPWSLDFCRLQVATAIDDAKRCPYCDDLITAKSFSFDHMVPVSRREEFREALTPFFVAPARSLFDSSMTETFSPEHMLLLCAYAWENIAICCIDCNKRKGEMTVADFATLRSALGLMSDVGKKYVWKKLLLSEHTLQAYVMRQRAIAQRKGAAANAAQDEDPNW